MIDEKLGKERRVRKKKEILLVLRKGKRVEDEVFKIFYMVRKKDSRIGVSIKRKIVNSVKRNKIRRRIKEIFRKERESFKKKVDMIIVVKKDVSEDKYIKTKERINNLIKKRGIL